MKSIIQNYILISLVCCILFMGCTGSRESINGGISFFCLRDSNKLHVKIFNKSNDTLFVPSQFIGTYMIGGDTIFLETTDKPKFGTTFLYKYRNVMPFEFFTTRKIMVEEPDSINKIFSQFSYVNQFGLGKVDTILPNTNHYQMVNFDVPKNSSFVSLVFYRKSLDEWKKEHNNSYSLNDFEEFDSLAANHIYTKIFDRYYPNFK